MSKAQPVGGGGGGGWGVRARDGDQQCAARVCRDGEASVGSRGRKGTPWAHRNGGHMPLHPRNFGTKGEGPDPGMHGNRFCLRRRYPRVQTPLPPVSRQADP